MLVKEKNKRKVAFILSFSGGGRHVKGGVLPAYCDPPNPCPKGYTAEDGCIEVEEFENRAEFSRKYQVRSENLQTTLTSWHFQASQNCMCDSEHMFSCPDVNSFDSMYKNQQVCTNLKT